jgi:hypothetical protein
MPRPLSIPSRATCYKVTERTRGLIDGTAATHRITKSGAVALLCERAVNESIALRIGDSVTLARPDGAIEFRVCLPGAAHTWIAALTSFAERIKAQLAKHGGLLIVE